jgi:hypothetical protein
MGEDSIRQRRLQAFKYGRRLAHMQGGAQKMRTNGKRMLPELRHDNFGEMSTGWVSGLISVLIVVLVGVALITPIQDSIDNSTATGASASLLSLVPLFVVIAIVLAVVYWAVDQHKGA